jgi:hypothetical protein
MLRDRKLLFPFPIRSLAVSRSTVRGDDGDDGNDGDDGDVDVSRRLGYGLGGFLEWLHRHGHRLTDSQWNRRSAIDMDSYWEALWEPNPINRLAN